MNLIGNSWSSSSCIPCLASALKSKPMRPILILTRFIRASVKASTLGSSTTWRETCSTSLSNYFNSWWTLTWSTIKRSWLTILRWSCKWYSIFNYNRLINTIMGLRSTKIATKIISWSLRNNSRPIRTSSKTTSPVGWSTADTSSFFSAYFTNYICLNCFMKDGRQAAPANPLLWPFEWVFTKKRLLVSNCAHFKPAPFLRYLIVIGYDHGSSIKAYPTIMIL